MLRDSPIGLVLSVLARACCFSVVTALSTVLRGLAGHTALCIAFPPVFTLREERVCGVRFVDRGLGLGRFLHMRFDFTRLRVLVMRKSHEVVGGRETVLCWRVTLTARRTGLFLLRSSKVQNPIAWTQLLVRKNGGVLSGGTEARVSY